MPRRAAPPPARPRVVQIYVGYPDLEYFRAATLGARHYGFETGRLAFADRWLPHDLHDLRGAVRRDGVQGVIAALHTRAEETRFLKLGVPVVNISNGVRAPRLPVVTQDDFAVGRLAAAHLRECGCRAFAFWGQAGASYALQRRRGFEAELGPAAKVWRGESPSEEAPRTTFERLRAWAAQLPPRTGVFAVLDSYAQAFLRAAREAGRAVPEDLAVLGAGDDDFYVAFERVPLSSIRLPAREIGYAAAALLDRLLRSGQTLADSLHLPGATLVPRRSTAIEHHEDPVLARALRAMHAQPGLKVGALARLSGVSAPALRRRFQGALGRSARAELGRVRMQRAEALLRDTPAKLAAIAADCGYDSVQRFSAAFSRAHAGLAPGAWRRARPSSTAPV
jgi:LacI family transcriptional regulator